MLLYILYYDLTKIDAAQTHLIFHVTVIESLVSLQYSIDKLMLMDIIMCDVLFPPPPLPHGRFIL